MVEIQGLEIERAPLHARTLPNRRKKITGVKRYDFDLF
jgi:hypothetical protein